MATAMGIGLRLETAMLIGLVGQAVGAMRRSVVAKMLKASSAHGWLRFRRTPEALLFR